MRNYLFILFSIFSLIFVNSCAIRNSLAPKVGLDAERTFYAQVLKDGESLGYSNIPAKLVKTTDHLAIYLQNGKSVSLYALNEMAQEFDYYYDDMTNIYGEHSDIDGNGKIIIFLMDINRNSAKETTLGYFNPYDMYDGNSGEVLYMDITKVNTETDNAIGTLIHEFQHLINYNYYLSGRRGQMSSWLNEALSESTSILFNKATAKSRIEEFNKINYYCFYTWNIKSNISNNGKSNSFVNYPSASVFMHWLYITNGSNPTIFSNIAHSTESADWMKVLKSAREEKLKDINSWGQLFLAWMYDIVNTNNRPKINGTEATNNMADGTISLYPGAMVVFDTYTNNVGQKTNTNNGKTIVLNDDKTLDLKGYVPIKVSGTSTTKKSKARQSSIANKEETKTINILLDRYGNIQKY